MSKKANLNHKKSGLDRFGYRPRSAQEIRTKLLRNARKVHREKWGMKLVPLTPVQITKLELPEYIWDERHIPCWETPIPEMASDPSIAEEFRIRGYSSKRRLLMLCSDGSDWFVFPMAERTR